MGLNNKEKVDQVGGLVLFALRLCSDRFPNDDIAGSDSLTNRMLRRGLLSFALFSISCFGGLDLRNCVTCWVTFPQHTRAISISSRLFLTR